MDEISSLLMITKLITVLPSDTVSGSFATFPQISVQVII